MNRLKFATRPRYSPMGIAIAMALGLLSSGTAIAQQAATQPSMAEQPVRKTAGDATPDDSSAESLTELQTVLVTATKRAQNIREIPASISVIGSEQLENQHATQLTDFAAYVPGLQVDSGGSPGQATISLRGIAPVGPGATVATYIDEVPVGSSANYARATLFALDLLPYDVDRIEILRGPQGTLYGAGSMGGLLKYVTRDPDLSTQEFRFGGGVSNVKGGGNGWDVRFGANLPLVEDRLAVRVGYSRNHLPGYIDNVIDGHSDVNKGEQESARIALLWQASDAVSVKLAAMRQTIDSDSNDAVELDAATLRPKYGDLTNNIYMRETFDKKIDFYSATTDWDLGWANFVSATGYTVATTDQLIDTTLVYGILLPLFGEPAGMSGSNVGLELDKFTQEFRLTSAGTGRFEWQVGAFYTDESSTSMQVVSATDFDGVPVPGLNPFAVALVPTTYEETAVFGDATYAFTNRFKLNAGLRFSRNKQAYREIFGGSLVGEQENSGESSESVTTWMLSPQFQLNDRSMLYARVATGYRPGGPNVGLPGVPSSVDADTLTNYELGLKSEFLDRRMTLDIAAFRIDWEDIQVIGNNGVVAFLINGGTAVSQGLELAAAFRATDHWSLALNAAYTDATLTQDVPGIGGESGDRLPYIPRWSWSANADYLFTLGNWDGRVGGGYRWVDERYTDVTSSPNAIPVDSYGAFDLNADISSGKWTLRAYVKNVGDERAYLSYGVSNSALTGEVARLQAVPVRPRTIGFEVDYRF